MNRVKFHQRTFCTHLLRDNPPPPPLPELVWAGSTFCVSKDIFNRVALVFSFPSAQYFASTMMIVGLSVVVTVLVLQFHHHDPHGGKMPKWVRFKQVWYDLGWLKRGKQGETQGS